MRSVSARRIVAHIRQESLPTSAVPTQTHRAKLLSVVADKGMIGSVPRYRAVHGFISQRTGRFKADAEGSAEITAKANAEIEA